MLTPIAQLYTFLPRRQQYADWTLQYSSYKDGMSLSAMYRKLRGQTGPVNHALYMALYIYPNGLHATSGFEMCSAIYTPNTSALS